MKAPLPINEEPRLEALRAFAALDTAAERAFDDIVGLASQICGTPIASISFVDQDRGWFKAKTGTTNHESPRDVAFCAHGILQPDIFEVEDTLADERFATNPMVTGGSKIRFYAGAPLVTSDGLTLGMLGVKGPVPRTLSLPQKEALRALSRLVVSQWEMRNHLQEWRRHVADRAASEKSARESDEKFRQLAENTTDVFWITTPDLKEVIYASPAYETIWGRPASRLYLHPNEWFDAIIPEDRERAGETFARLAIDLKTVTIEYRIARPDGEVRWISSRGAQVRDEAGTMIRIKGIATDITERKRAEETLERQRTELRVLFDFIPAMICFKDTDNRIIRANQKLADTVGKSIREIEGKPADEIFPEEGGKFFADDLEVIRTGKPMLEIIESFRDQTGREIWVQTAKVPVSDQQGKIVGIIAMALDITQRKEHEAQLARLRTEHAIVLDALGEGVQWVDADGAIKYYNPAAAKMLGYGAAELIGRLAHPTLHHTRADGRPHPPLSSPIFETLSDGVPRRVTDDIFWRKDGTNFPVEYVCTPVREMNGNPTGAVVAFTDITRRKMAEAAQRDSEFKFQQLADSISDVFWICSPNFRTIHYVSVGYEAIWGRTQASLYADPHQWIDAIMAEERGPTMAGFSKIMGDQPAVSLEYRIIRPDGTIRWIHDRGFQVRDETGKLIRLTGIASDITERKTNEEVIQRREAELRILFNLMPALIWFKDTKNKILRVNQRVADLAGKTVAEIEGKPSAEIYPQDAARYYIDDLEVIRSGAPKLGYVEAVDDPTGGQRWIQTDKVPYRDEAGKTIGIVVLAQDITERRRDEEKLRLLSSAIEQSTESIIITDARKHHPDPRIVFVNAAFTALTGYTSKEVIGKTPRLLQGPRTDRAVILRLRRALAKGGSFHGETINYRKDGTTLDLEWQVTPIRDHREEVTHFVTFQRDTTERNKAQEALRLLSSALEQSKESIVITDAQLELPGPRILFVNSAFTAMTGYTADEVHGKTPRVLQGPRTDRAVTARLRKTLAQGGTFQGESINYRKDGSPFDHEWQVAPVRNLSGVITNFVAVQRDVTARKLAEAELLRAREEAIESTRLKSRFLANMSHELRTPLNTINGLSATMVEQDLPPAVKRSASLILQCGEALLENIQTILTHSSLEAGQTVLDAKPFALTGIVLNALRITGEAAQRKGLSLNYDLDPRVPTEMVGDPSRIQQILVNLLANAIKFTDKGRVYLRVHAGARPDGRWTLSISVADTGIGIAPANIGRLFKPFYQTDNSLTRRFEGTGLGLAITKSLIDMMDGSVAVRSRLETGTIIQVKLTLGAVAGSPATGAAGASSELIGRRVLIVEPNPLHRRHLLALALSWQLRATLTENSGAAPPARIGDGYDLVIRHAPFTGAVPESETAQDATTLLPTVWLLPHGRTLPSSTGRSVAVFTPFKPLELSAAMVALLSNNSAREAPAVPTRQKLGERLPLRILSADDIHTNREVLTVICHHLGYQTDMAENGAEVLERLNTRTYDLILLDVQMPVMDGLSAAREICRRYPDPRDRPRIVAVTASALAGDRESCLAAGMEEYLSKPILPRQLQACIERLFKRQLENPAKEGPAPDARPRPSLLNRAHLESLTAGMDPPDASELIVQLFTAVKTDIGILQPQVAAACAARAAPALRTSIHGLKGCVLSLGWTRMGERCAETLDALRENTFERWDELPSELDALYRASARELDHLLKP